MEERRARRLLEESPPFRELSDSNLERGRRFRELFAEHSGVVVLPSGAQYLVVKAGDGRSPGPNDTVSVKVRAQLLDRSVLDEGITPFDIEVGGTLPGGTEILQLMSVGAQWQVALPPELAFGVAGRYPDIGPNETIALTVDLIEIKRPGAGGTP
jgi:FKBP-type peptidyl-prolyl cis-trans isomerase FklB